MPWSPCRDNDDNDPRSLQDEAVRKANREEFFGGPLKRRLTLSLKRKRNPLASSDSVHIIQNGIEKVDCPA